MPQPRDTETIDDPRPSSPEATLRLPSRYRFLARIGRGASGEVLRVHDRVLDRPVAFKRLRLDADPARSERFLREARLTAALQHPGIIAIHDLGQDPLGVWFTMRELTGGTLEAAVAAGMDPARRLDALLQACDAVAAAHMAGVVHLDLKPQNIAVGAFGEVVVLDWGVARSLEEADPHPVSGTPGWWAPEQARGEAPGPQADVYALGRMLGWLMEGEVSDEVDAIVRRATDPDPTRRYPDAGALAAELRRWRDGRRVEALRYTPTADLRRFVRHHRALSLVTLLAFAGIALALVVALAQRSVAVDRLAVALAERAASAMRAGDLVDAGVLGAASLALRESPEARGAVLAAGSAGLPRLRWQLDRRPSEVAVTRPDDPRGALPSGRAGPERACTAADLHPDGARIACGTTDGVLLIDSRDGAIRRIGDGRVGAVAFSPDGARIALGRVVPDGNVVELDLTTGEELRRFHGHARGTWSLSYLPGDRILSSGDDRWLRTWPTGPEITGADHISFHAASPDGRRAIFATGRWADLDTGEQGLLVEGADTLLAAWSPSGQRVVGAGGDRDGDLRLWDAQGQLQARVSGVFGGTTRLAFLSETLLASAGKDGQVGLWSLLRSRQRVGLHAHEGEVDELRAVGGRLLTTGTDLRIRLWEIDPEGVWGQRQSVRARPELARVGDRVALGQEVEAPQLLDGRSLAVVGTLPPAADPHFAELGGEVLSSNIRGGLWLDGVRVKREDTFAYLDALVVDGGRIFELLRGDYHAQTPWAELRILDGASFDQLDSWELGVGATFLAARDGRVLTGGPTEALRIRRWPSGEVELERAASPHGFTAGALGPTGYAVGRTDGLLQVGVWEARTAEVVAANGAITAVALSPAGALMATGGADGTVRIWSLPDLAELARVALWPAPPSSLVFVDDGLVGAWADGVVRRLDLSFLYPTGAELQVRFCRDWGMRLVEGTVTPVAEWSPTSCG